MNTGRAASATPEGITTFTSLDNISGRLAATNDVLVQFAVDLGAIADRAFGVVGAEADGKKDGGRISSGKVGEILDQQEVTFSLLESIRRQIDRLSVLA